MTIAPPSDAEAAFYRQVQQKAGERLSASCLALIARGDGAEIDAQYPRILAGFPWICASPDVPRDDLQRYSEALIPRMNLRGDWSAAVEILERAREREDWPEAKNWLAWFYELAGLYDEAEAVARQGLADATRLEAAPARCLAFARVAKVLRTRGEYRQALEIYGRARELAEAAHEAALTAYVLNSSGLTLWHLGELEEALSYLHRAWQRAEGLAEPRLQGQIKNDLGIVLIALGDYEAARQDLEAALLLVEGLDDRREIGVVCGNRGEVEHHLGHLDEARFYQERALQIAEELGNLYRIAKAKVRLSALLTSLGDPESLVSAARLAREAVELGHEKKLHHFLILGRSYESLALFLLGRQGEAEAFSREAVEVLAAHEHFDGSRAEVLYHHSLIFAAGAPEEARRAALAAGEALSAVAGRIRDPQRRERFLTAVALNRAIREAVERIHDAAT